MPSSYAGKTERWTTLVANAEPLLSSVPAAQELHADLKASTTELGAMAHRIQDLLGEAHTLAKRRQDPSRNRCQPNRERNRSSCGERGQNDRSRPRTASGRATYSRS
jgi:hypothetical protein